MNTKTSSSLTAHLPLIEQGNTVQGVTAFVVQQIKSKHSKLNALFDLPCGQGHFLKALRQIFPNTQLQGMDAHAQPLPEVQDLILKQVANDWHPTERSYDVVTCISGVMCFDNLEVLFEKSFAALKPGGEFYLTNDNVLTLRDRLSWFFFGHPKRFRLMYQKSEGNWNLVLPQALYRFYEKYNFENIEVHYLSARTEDWFFTPLALVLYPFQLLHLLMFNKTHHSLQQKMQLYPFRALICRHYVLVGTKKRSLEN